MRKLKRPAAEFLRFVIAGLINTGLTYLLCLELMNFMHYLAAYSCAYVVGILISYGLNSVFVFKAQLSTKTAVRFPLVYLIQYVWGTSFLWVLVQGCGINKKIAVVFVIVSGMLITFFLLKKLFRSKTL